ncbi:MAG: formate/nitrite transporter family protein [Rhodothermales bacterium]
MTSENASNIDGEAVDPHESEDRLYPNELLEDGSAQGEEDDKQEKADDEAEEIEATRTHPNKVLKAERKRAIERRQRTQPDEEDEYPLVASLREALEESREGAPSAGEAVTDIFSTEEVFQRIIARADEEFSQPRRLLFFSGLAAGLITSLSFLSRAALSAAVGTPEPGLVSNLLYPVGFIFIVIGHYQLFTETTLTPVTLVITRLASLPRLLMIWGLVFVANILGAAIAAYFLAHTGTLDPDATKVALAMGTHALEVTWGALFSKGIIAGWLVAGMVWLVHAVRSGVARLLIIYLLMYMIPSADLYHCIIGSSETFYAFFRGEATLLGVLWDFITPVTLGNTTGGVLLVALLNFAQTRETRFPDRVVLSWRAWFLGHDRENQDVAKQEAEVAS